jgi:hypothetical protein
MKTTDSNTILVNSYFKLLQGLSLSGKADLISKLSQSIKTHKPNHKPGDFEKAFGSWEGNESAEELITSIKQSRTFKREIEEL